MARAALTRNGLTQDALAGNALARNARLATTRPSLAGHSTALRTWRDTTALRRHATLTRTTAAVGAGLARSPWRCPTGLRRDDGTGAVRTGFGGHATTGRLRRWHPTRHGRRGTAGHLTRRNATGRGR
jgi:hypothetical protein